MYNKNVKKLKKKHHVIFHFFSNQPEMETFFFTDYVVKPLMGGDDLRNQHGSVHVNVMQLLRIIQVRLFQMRIFRC